MSTRVGARRIISFVMSTCRSWAFGPRPQRRTTEKLLKPLPQSTTGAARRANGTMRRMIGDDTSGNRLLVLRSTTPTTLCSAAQGTAPLPGAEQLGVVGRQLHDRHAAHRVTDQHDRPGGAGLDDRVQVGGEVLDRAALAVSDVGRAVRALVHEHHADLAAQGEPLVVPGVERADDAVHEHDRRQVRCFGVGLVDLHVDADAVGRHHLAGCGVHRAERDVLAAAEPAALGLPVVEELGRDPCGDEGSGGGRDLGGCADLPPVARRPRHHRAPR